MAMVKEPSSLEKRSCSPTVRTGSDADTLYCSGELDDTSANDAFVRRTCPSSWGGIELLSSTYLSPVYMEPPEPPLTFSDVSRWQCMLPTEHWAYSTGKKSLADHSNRPQDAVL